MSIQFTRLLAIVAMSGLASWSAQAAALPHPYTSLLVFGDSLSDPGNVAGLMQLNGIPNSGGPGLPNPVTGTFSNGPTAAQHLANALGVSSTPGWLVPSGGTNFALGGAMTGSSNLASALGLLPVAAPALPGITQQIALFDPSGPYGSRPLYFLQGGANDFFYTFNVGQTMGWDAATFGAALQSTAETAVTNMVSNVQSLVAKGAHTILVGNLPNLGLTPDAMAQGPEYMALASMLTNNYNAAFGAAMAQLGQGLGADYTLRVFDFGSVMRSAVTSGAFANSTGMCAADPQAVVDGCEGYLFWDFVHPTTQAHALVGQALFAEAMAAAVPEPATWLMVAGGLLLVLRRARQQSRTPA